MPQKRFIALSVALSIGAAALATTADAATKTTKSTKSKTTKAAPTTVKPATTVAATATPTTAAQPAAAARGGKPVDPNGVLRIATQFNVGPGYNIDPAKGTIVTYDGIAYLNVGMPLLSRDGVLEPYLAEGYKILSSRTLVLTLRKGVTFHDGKPYDAQTLRDAYLARRDLGPSNVFSTIFQQIDTISVDSPTQLTFKLSTSSAGLLAIVLGTANGSVASPGSNPNLPAGAGPYKNVEYRDKQFLKLERWDGFYRAKDFPIKTVEYTHIADPAAKQSALRAGQVDLISNAPSDADALVGTGPFAKVVTNNEGTYQFSFCGTSAPSFDTKFRKAVMLAIDKNQINQVVLGGNAVPLEGFFPPSSKFAVKGLLKPQGDQEAARALLKEINWDSSKVMNLGVFNVPTHQRIVEVIQGQLEKVGIKVQVRPIPVRAADTINDKNGGGGIVLAQVSPGIQKMSTTFIDRETSYNPCSFTDAAMAVQIQRLTDGDATEKEQIEVWTSLQKRVIEDALAIPLLTQPAVYVYNKDRVQGIQAGTVGLTGATAPSLLLDGVSMIAK